MSEDIPRFTEDEIIADIVVSQAIGGRQPTAADLSKALKKYGPTGILESAVHLSAAEYRSLEQDVREATPKKRKKMRMPKGY